MSSPKLSLLVSSCDAYSDLWNPCFNLINKYWADCPLDQYLMSNELKFESTKVQTLCVGRRGNWSDELSAALHVIPTDYVLIMLEDFFLRKKVSNDAIEYCRSFAERTEAICVRLIPNPGPTDRLPGENLIGACAPQLTYRISTQAAIWNRKQLLKLLKPGESIWEFEFNSNERLQMQSGVYSVWRAVLPYQGWLSHHVVEKGRWLPHEKWIYAFRQIGCNFEHRDTLPFGKLVFYHAARCIDLGLTLLPWKAKQETKQILKRLLSPLLGAQINQLRSGGHRAPNAK